MTVTRRWSRQDAYDGLIQQAATKYGVTVPLIKAIIAKESGFNPAAINRADPGWAWGLMQMLPTTAAALGYSGPMDRLLGDPALAIDLGTKLLAENLRRTQGVIADSVAAYNGGWRMKLPTGGFQNQAYVDDVLALVDYFRMWEAQKGGPGFGPATFSVVGPGPRPAVPDPPVATVTAPPLMRFPVWGVVGGAILWILVAFGMTCFGG